MLSPADAQLVARDRALPGLALILDPDALLDALRSVLPGARLDGLEVEYLRYKPGTNCLAAFALDISGSPVRGYAKAYRPDDAGKLEKADVREGVPGPLGPGRIVLDEAAVELAFFPNDNKLRKLGSLLDPIRRRGLLARITSQRPELQDGSLTVLNYKPERRFVARLDIDGSPAATLKLYTRRSYQAASTAAAAIQPTSAFSVPQLLGHSRSYGVLLFAWQRGTQLGSALKRGAWRHNDVVQVGSALAELHAQQDLSLPVRTRAGEATVLQDTASGLASLYLPAAGLAGELADNLSAALMDSPSSPRPAHRDFYDRQVLLTHGGVMVLDFDEAVLTDPAADLGSFIAHLEWDALRGELPAKLVAPVREALLEGYGPLPPRVDLYTAIGLLQLAPHHFRLREPEWAERTLVTLERAASMLEGYRSLLPVIAGVRGRR